MFGLTDGSKDNTSLFYAHVMEYNKERSTAFSNIFVETESRNNSVLVMGRTYLVNWGSLLSAGQLQMSVCLSMMQ
jgi:hypothetical protein